MLREKVKQRTCKSESTDAGHRGGLMCSSVEVLVMSMERRHQIILQNVVKQLVKLGGLYA